MIAGVYPPPAKLVDANHLHFLALREGDAVFVRAGVVVRYGRIVAGSTRKLVSEGRRGGREEEGERREGKRGGREGEREEMEGGR